MVKNFPKTRVSVINCYPALESGMQKAIYFAHKYNIQLNSKDGKKIVFNFCVESIEAAHKKLPTNYPKVLCLDKRKIASRLKFFIKEHFFKITKHLSVPYCGECDLSSPDLEYKAQSSLRTNKRLIS